MLSSSFGQKQEITTCTGFCNYMVSAVEGLDERDFQTFRNEAVKLLSNIQSKAEECATDISTAKAASSSCKGIHLNHPRDRDAFKLGLRTPSAEPSDQQRTAAAVQRAADFLHSR